MGEGDGDCDTDADCADGLLCGSANCGDFYKTDYWPYDRSYGGWDHVDDCCYAPVEQVAPLHSRPQPRPYCEYLTLFSCSCPHPRPCEWLGWGVWCRPHQTLARTSLLQVEGYSRHLGYTCETSPTLVDDSTVFFFVAPTSTWADARAYCVAQGGDLVSIHSAEEDAAASAFMYASTTSSYPWIGMSTQTCSNGCGGASDRASQYTWSDGTPFDYENPTWYLNDAAPTYGHYYRDAPYTGDWGTHCATCQAEGICQSTGTPMSVSVSGTCSDVSDTTSSDAWLSWCSFSSTEFTQVRLPWHRLQCSPAPFPPLASDHHHLLSSAALVRAGVDHHILDELARPGLGRLEGVPLAVGLGRQLPLCQRHGAKDRGPHSSAAAPARCDQSPRERRSPPVTATAERPGSLRCNPPP